jgi:ribonuclease HI
VVNGKKVQSPAIHSWKPPSENFLQINTDSTYDQNTRTGGWGFVVRDSKGEVLLAGAGKFMRAASVIQTVVVAALKAIQQAAQLGMTHIILEADASVLAISSLLHRN